MDIVIRAGVLAQPVIVVIGALMPAMDAANLVGFGEAHLLVLGGVTPPGVLLAPRDGARL